MRRPMDFDYYTERKYRAQYPADLRVAIQQKAARDVSDQLGYTVIKKQ